MRQTNKIVGGIDWLTVLLFTALVIIGWVSIYAAVYNEEHDSIFSFSERYGKQLIWIGTAAFLAILILVIDSNFYTTFAFPIYGIMMFVLLLVLVLGTEINGARSWFKIGSFALQPSELAKVATSLALAKYLSTLNIKMERFKTKLIAACIIGIPPCLILLQPDAGSAIIYAAFIFALYREGLSGNILLFGLLGIIVFITTLIFGPMNIIIVAFYAFLVIYMLTKFKFITALWSVLGLSVILISLSYLDWSLKYMYIVIGASLVALSLYLITKKELKGKLTHFLMIGVFIGCCGFIYSIDFTFNNILKEHHRTRITVLLGEEDKLVDQIDGLKLNLEDTTLVGEQRLELKEQISSKKESLKKLRSGALWNIKQSLIAIGSGGLAGKGFLQGTQTKFDFVPEQSTDFIFCTIGEEWGFIGTLVTIALFVTLLLRIIFLAERQRSPFTRIYGYCVASILFFHFSVNIAMTIGLAPVIGIPLPMISYGGSSLWAFTILLFIFLKLDANKLMVFR